MTDDKLKSLSERINRLLDDRDGLNGDISEIYQEAKSAGYIPKVLRKAIARMRMDASKRAEEDAILELYEGALDGRTRAVLAEIRAGSTLDATSEKTGTPRRTVARIAMTVPKTSRNGTAPKAQVISPPEAEALPLATPAHDAETGVILETSSQAAGGMAVQEGGQPPSAEPVPNAGAAGGAEAPAPITQSCGGRGVEAGEFSADEEAAARRFMGQDGVTVEVKAEPGSLFDRVGQLLEHVAPGRVQRDTTASAADDDDLAIPAFLRRVPA